MPRHSLPRLALLAAMLAPNVAFAHTGVEATGGLAHGFMHPIGGLDHVLAMVLVGVLAWQLGGRALWLVPLTFVAVMALAGAVGVAGIGLPLVEIGIAMTVVVLGAVVASGAKAPVAAAMAMAGLFAIFHGHAHGAEMPETMAGAVYAVGFMLGTALLHLVGLGVGCVLGSLGERRGRTMTRAAGGVAAIAGVAILTGIL
jgi:urease accessory protein